MTLLAALFALTVGCGVKGYPRAPRPDAEPPAPAATAAPAPAATATAVPDGGIHPESP